jgi:hypothetical protein
MPENEDESNNEDKAWVEFNTPLDQNALLNFCQNIERLFRINPYLEFETWEQISQQTYRMSAINHSQNSSFKIDTELKVNNLLNGLEIKYSKGIKSSTMIIIKPFRQGSKITITDNYKSKSKQERIEHLHEVDKSLTKWAEEIQQYLVLWKRWSWFSPWRFYKNQIWQPMKPSGRRITYMLIWISLFEIALIGLGVIIYYVEYR